MKLLGRILLVLAGLFTYFLISADWAKASVFERGYEVKGLVQKIELGEQSTAITLKTKKGTETYKLCQPLAATGANVDSMHHRHLETLNLAYSRKENVKITYSSLFDRCIRTFGIGG